MSKKILITGSKGFVGINLIPYLSKNNYKVTGITRSSKAGEISYEELNLNIWNSSKALIHLAGKAHDLKNITNDEDYFEINTELTKKVFNQFLKSECKIFIYMSSVKAVTDVVEGLLTEETLPNPITAYGKSKLAAENYILENLPTNKKVYILRPCMIHGPGNKGNLNLLYKLVFKGLPWPLGAFENKRSFTSIDNLNFIIKNLIEKDIPSGVYNVADDVPISTNKLIKLMGLGIDRKTRVLNVPKKLIILLAKIGDQLNLPLNRERLKKLTESYVVSNDKLKKALDIKNMPVNSEDGILKTIKSFNTK